MTRPILLDIVKFMISKYPVSVNSVHYSDASASYVRFLIVDKRTWSFLGNWKMVDVVSRELLLLFQDPKKRANFIDPYSRKRF